MKSARNKIDVLLKKKKVLLLIYSRTPQNKTKKNKTESILKQSIQIYSNIANKCNHHHKPSF